MVEQQLIDYIKKAREAGQQDFQTKSLLLKNGWSDSEVNEALTATISATPQSSLTPQTQPKAQPQQSQTQSQQTTSQPQVQQPTSQPQQSQQIAQQRFRPTQQPSVSTQRSGSGIGGLLIAIIIIVFVIILLLGGGFVYILHSKIYNPLWNPFSASTEEIVFSSLITNLENVKSYRLETTGKITLTNTTSGYQTSLNMSSQSDINLTDENLPKTNSLFSVYSTVGANTPFVSINTNTVTIGENLYIKINEWITDEEQIPDLKDFQGQWLKFDQESSAFFQSSGETQIEQIAELASGVNLLPQNIADLKSWFLVEKRLEDEVVDGQEMYRYSGIVNKNNLNLEVWIRKNDSTFYGYKFKKALNPNIVIDITSRVYDFNDPANIIEPEDTQKIEEIIQPIIKAQMIGLDLKNIWIIAQTTQKKTESYAELCYKGLLNGYLEGSGDYLIELNNKIVAQGAKKPTCFSSVDNFCISSELPSGTFVCIDKNGIAGTEKCVSATTECK